MPSRRHNSAMLDSPRKPSSTMRIFSSEECRLRVARRMFFTIRSDDDSGCTDFCLISTPCVVTMSQKSSVPQAAKSVSQALMSDKESYERVIDQFRRQKVEYEIDA